MFDVVELSERCRKAAGDDVTLVSDAELLVEVEELARCRAALDAREVHVLAELEVRGTCDREFGTGTSSWVAHVTRADRRSVAARVKTGLCLRRSFDELDAALCDGRVSLDHAAVMARAANPRIEVDLAAEQTHWVGLAERSPFRAWSSALAVRAELLDHDGGFDPDRERARNRLSIRRLGDGIVFRGELYGDLAVGFTQPVDTKRSELWRQSIGDHAEAGVIVPPTDTLQAEALAELVRLGSTVDQQSTPGPVVDLALVIEQHRPDVVQSTDRDLVIATRWAEHLVCAAQLSLVRQAVTGVILDVGRAERYATRAQRRALTHRDGGCVFPGCSTPASWCDAHHVHHWEHDGNTDMPNLALLCRHHHRVTHRQGWAMVTNPDHTFTWTTPSGRTLTSQRQHGRPPPGG